jgi:hypothetical protein
MHALYTTGWAGLGALAQFMEHLFCIERGVDSGGTVTEADHILGDLLHRQSELAVISPSLLRIAYLHLKTYEARRAREGISSAGA